MTVRRQDDLRDRRGRFHRLRRIEQRANGRAVADVDLGEGVARMY
jgi:hypothetical protein